MKERPIIFGAESIRAILEGRKTQTRRVVKPQPLSWKGSPIGAEIERGRFMGAASFVAACPYGQPGDRLWVRETWAATATRNNVKPSELTPGEFIAYRATYSNSNHFVWRPSIFMPRWASRINLEITGIRLERVQDISEADAKAEGVESAQYSATPHGQPLYCFRSGFRQGWDSLNRKRGFGWEQNPWVFVVEFKRINP